MTLVSLSRRALDAVTPDSASPIGLDVGGRWVKAVQFHRSSTLSSHPAGLRVAAAVRFLRDHDRAAASPGALVRDELRRAADILRRAGFRGAAIVLPLPAHAQISAAVRLPDQSHQPGQPPPPSTTTLGQIALAHLADHARLTPDALVASWWPTSPPPPVSPAPAAAARDATSLAFALGGRRKDIDTLLDAFDGSGLEPVAVDARPCALVRAAAPLRRAPTDAADPPLWATIDIGSASGTLGVAHLGRLVYERTLPEFGTAALRASLAHHLDLEPDVADFILSRIGLGPPPADAPAPPEQSAEVLASARELIAHHVDAMARELQASIAYARTALAHPDLLDHAPTPVFLVGGGAHTPGLPDRIRQVMNAPARALHLDDLARVPDHIPPDARSSSMIVAAGLALNDPRARATEAAA